jgi:DNA-binding winged helix-turn-helix (wHTH) protein
MRGVAANGAQRADEGALRGVGHDAGRRDVDEPRRHSLADPPDPVSSRAPVRVRLPLGRCVLDLERQVLLDPRGEPVRLRPRAWNVLRCLAEREGRLVGKGALMTAVWRDAAVTDDSLVQAVADIRRALGAEARQVLRTVPGRGYLLLAGSAGRLDPETDAASGAAQSGAARSRAVAASLGDRLRERAARRFVGREAELELLGAAVGRAPPEHALFFVHGPGGIGKSTLLEQLRRMAEPGVDVVSVNGAELLPTPQGVIDGMGSALALAQRLPTADDVRRAWAERGRSVLLLDGFEALDPVQGWMRDTWLPGLPGDLTVVLAGRRAPDSRWSAHPLWGGAMQPVPLGMLGASACAELVAAHGTPAALCARLAKRSGGLPLAAVLLAAEVRRTGRLPQALGDALVIALTHRCLEQSPSAQHREALLACALARCATRGLLVHLFGAPAGEGLFAWLAEQGYVSSSRDGLRLHDLMREAVLAEAGGCDRDRFRELRREVVRWLAARLGPGRDAWDATLDFFYARRNAPGFRRYHDVDGRARTRTQIGVDADLNEVFAFAGEHLPGSEHAALRRWVVHPAAEVVTIRADERSVCGVAVLLRLDALDDGDVLGDPVVAGLRAALGSAWSEPAGRTYSLFARHGFTEGHPEAPTPALTAMMASVNPHFADPALRLFALWGPIPRFLEAMYVELGFQRLPGAARDLDAHRYEMIVRDWQAEPWGDWVRRVVTPGLPAHGPEQGRARACATPERRRSDGITPAATGVAPRG